jgi:hypothetical protein
VQGHQAEDEYLQPSMNRAALLLRRGLLETHQGVVDKNDLDCCLEGFTFRIKRRLLASQGKRLYRLSHQTLQVDLVPRNVKKISQRMGLGRGKSSSLENYIYLFIFN